MTALKGRNICVALNFLPLQKMYPFAVCSDVRIGEILKNV